MDCRSQVVYERIQVASTWFRRLQGLLFKCDFEGSLLIAPCHAVHTWGMERAVDVAFLDESGCVVASYCSIRPRQLLRCHGAHAVLERFSRDDPWFRPGDQIVLDTAKDAKGES